MAPVEDVRPESLGHGDSDMSVGSIGVGLDEVPVPGAPIIRTAVGQREVLDDWTFSDGGEPSDGR